MVFPCFSHGFPHGFPHLSAQAEQLVMHNGRRPLARHLHGHHDLLRRQRVSRDGHLLVDGLRGLNAAVADRGGCFLVDFRVGIWLPW